MKKDKTSGKQEPGSLVPLPDRKPVGVAAQEREGVFINGFICQHCGLHFNLFSWQANRHRTANTYCPECGRKGAFLHYRMALNANPIPDKESRGEIFRYVPWPGSQLMDDSVIFSPEGEKTKK